MSSRTRRLVDLLVERFHGDLLGGTEHLRFGPRAAGRYAHAGQKETTMIARIWRGVTREADVEAYNAYLEDTGLAEYRSTPGNRGVQVLVRREGNRAEWLLVTWWDSLEAIKRFAGEDVGAAVFYPEDDRYLLERGERVEHFEVVTSSGLV